MAMNIPTLAQQHMLTELSQTIAAAVQLGQLTTPQAAEVLELLARQLRHQGGGWGNLERNEV